MAARQVCFIAGLPLKLGRQGQTAHQLRQGGIFCPSLYRTRNTYTTSTRPIRAARFSHAASTTATAISAPRESTNTDDEDPDPETEPEIFHVGKSDAGKRLDKVLASQFPAVSRSYLQSLLDDGNVLVDGLPVTTKSRKTLSGETVEVRFITPERDLPLSPEDIPLDILYEDEHLIAVNKPAGMVVHPAPGNWRSTLVHALTFRYSSLRALGGPRPGIVHRLDKGTSGVILAALTPAAQRELMALFASRAVTKDYVAITVGNPAGTGCLSRMITEPIGRSPTDRLRMAVLPEEAGGRAARSRVSVEGRDDRGLLHVAKVRIDSGRTHQIRVHLRHVRAPILGDDLYGASEINRRFRSAATRPMLHAHSIAFEHPVTGQAVAVSAPLPDDMRSLLRRTVLPDFESKHPEW